MVSGTESNHGARPQSVRPAPVERGLRVAGLFVLTLVGCDGVSVAIDAATGDVDAGPAADLDGSFAPDATVLDGGVLDATVVDGGDRGGPTEPAFADTVVDAPGAGDRPFGDPELAVNGVRGAGGRAGSLDVYSIQYGGHLVLSWGGRRVQNGDGDDLVVFENPFENGPGVTFMDHIVVELSRDGDTWVTFPHDYIAADETIYSAVTDDWIGFAGVQPVFLHAESMPVDPFDAAAGGDRFDLDALPSDGEAGRIRDEGFVFVRLSPAPDHVNPDTGAPFVRTPISNGPDIDGVHARYVEMP